MKNCLNILKSSPRGNVGNLPFYLIDDKIYPLKSWLMRPYPGPMMIDEAIKINNYSLSRACHVIENSFGILSMRWIFQKPIKAYIENVERCTLACINGITQLSRVYRFRGQQWKNQTWTLENRTFSSSIAIRGSHYSKTTVEMQENL